MNIKKIISVLLMAAVLPQTGVFAEKTADYSESINFLSAAHVLENYTRDDSEKSISRIEFAKLLARIVYPDNNYYWQEERAYEDVAAEYKAIVSALAEQKIMLGYDEATFAPEQPITYNEALKALVSMVGYDYNAESSGGYPNGYVSCASDIGILKGMSDRSNHELTLGEIALLIKNALKVDIMTMNIDGSGASYSTEKGENLLKTKLGMYEGEGILKANEFSDIYGDKFAGKNSVVIGDYSYEISDKSFEKYLGHKIEFYYTADDKDSADRKLVSVSDAKNVETLSIKSNEITDFADRAYSYTLDGETRDRRAKISDDALVLYNYRVPKTKSGEDLYLPQEGKIDMVDNDGDGKYDVVFVWDYETYVVNSVSAESYMIDDYYGKPALDLDPDETDYIITKNGEEIGLDKLEKWNVLSVARSEDDDPYITIAVSDTRVTASAGFSDDEVTLDGKEYKLSSAFTQARKSGETLDWYLDFLGYVVVYDKNSTSDYIHHGIIVGYRIEDDAPELPPDLKIFNEDGVMTWYKTNKKIKLDGVSGLKSSELFDRESPNVLIDENGIIPQMIAYCLNNNGEINYIDTVEKGVGEDDETLNQSDFKPTRSGWQYMLLGHTWSDEIALALNTVIFRTPSDSTGNILRGAQYDKYYEIRPFNVWMNPFYDHYDIYPVRFFNINKSQVSDLMIWYVPVDGSDAEFTRGLFMVKSVDSALNDENEEVVRLNGWMRGEEKSVILETGREALVDGLKAGQIIQYALNKSDEVMAITKILDPSETAADGKPGYMISSTVPYATTRCLYGEITSIDRDNNVIVVNYKFDDEGKLSGKGIVNVLNGESGNNGVVVKYNAKTNKIEKGAWSDLQVGQAVILDKCETAVRSVTILEK